MNLDASKRTRKSPRSITALLRATQDDRSAANDEHRYLPYAVSYISHDDLHDETQIPGQRPHIHGACTTTGVASRRLRAVLRAVHRGSQQEISRSENCFLPGIHTFTSFRKRQILVVRQFSSHNLTIRVHLSLPDVYDLGELSYNLA